MKSTSYFAVVVSLLFVFTLGMSQGNGRSSTPPRWQGMAERLNLTDSQKKDVEKLNTDFAKQRVDQQAKVKTARIDLRALLKSDSPSKDAIEKKIGEIADLQAQNKVLGVEHWFAVNKLLTPDQQKIWKNMLDRTPGERMAMRIGRMRDRVMRFFHRGPGPAQSNTP